MFNNNKYPKLYTESQQDVLENHIFKHFGAFSNDEPFADNTKLSEILIDFPYAFGVEDRKVNISPKEIVQFYQLIPIYDEEMEYKLINDAQALTRLFDENFSDIININRKNYCLSNGNE